MVTEQTCPECGAEMRGEQEGELCERCADKRFKKSNNWHNDYVGKANE